MEREGLFEELARRRVVFVAGSGISTVCGVPSTEAILGHTLRAYLPRRYQEVEGAIRGTTGRGLPGSFQPEIVYEHLVLLDGERCLDIWDVLAEGYPPSSTHCFLVRYAWWSGLPVVTTNFDLLFEEAGRELGLEAKVYLPGCGRERLLLDRPEGREFLLWKVHGSVGVGGRASLRTTMESISRRNYALISALGQLLANRKVCFVGYSGRDVDLFPELCAACRGDSYWLRGPRGRPEDPDLAERIKESRGIRVHEWPEELFVSGQREGHLPDALCLAGLESVERRVSEAATARRRLAALQKRPAAPSSIEREELLALMLLKDRGLYRLAWEKAVEAEPEVLSPFGRSLRLLAMVRLAHERSRYLDCEDLALRGLQAASTLEGPSRTAFRLLFRCLVAEARRMQMGALFPGRDILGVPANLALGIFVLASFLVAEFLMSLDEAGSSGKATPASRILWLQARFERIEHRIRGLAILQKLYLRLLSQAPFVSPAARRLLDAAWGKLIEQSHRVGYASGLANCHKFLARLHGTRDLRRSSRAARRLYSMMHQTTGLELVGLDEAQDRLQEGDLAGAEERYRSSLEQSLRSGNVLNSVKALIGIMHCRSGRVSADELERFRRLAMQVQGADWQRVLGVVEERLAPGVKRARIHPEAAVALRGEDGETHYGLRFRVASGSQVACRSSLPTTNADWLPVFDRRYRGGVTRWRLVHLPSAELPDRHVLLLPRTWLIRNRFLPLGTAWTRTRPRRLRQAQRLLEGFWVEPL